MPGGEHLERCLHDESVNDLESIYCGMLYLRATTDLDLQCKNHRTIDTLGQIFHSLFASGQTK
jgi:hypothetical protein